MTVNKEVKANTKYLEFLAGDLVSVLLPLPLGEPYVYRVPLGMRIRIGDFALVPLGPRTRSGVIWGPGAGDIKPNRIKEIFERHDCPPLTQTTMGFLRWVANYAMHPLGGVLKMAISVSGALNPPKPIIGYILADSMPKIRMTPERKRVLGIAAKKPVRIATSLAHEASVTPSVVKSLAEAGALKTVSLDPANKLFAPDPEYHRTKLTKVQEKAADELVKNVEAQKFSVTLLDGVPGAGKTEVYFQAVAAALRQGKQVLVLLPEIALSAQWMERFRSRFGNSPAEWHSDLTQGRRRVTWRAVAEGTVQAIVGARSALFLPFRDLGLIVVDEEHETAFKQEEGVIYNARDMAVVRAKLGDFPVILASATPSLETIVNTKRGRYSLLHLPARHGGATLPKVELIDMLKTTPQRGRWLSPVLETRLRETLGAGEQALLFLNRRGYAPLTLCRTCGYRFQCTRCTAWLVEHRQKQYLQCHYCGFQLPQPKSCPSCEAEKTLVPCGPGVERLMEEVQLLFPNARSLIATSDSIHSPKIAAQLVKQIETHQVDIIIGTQIVAKGYHFPMLTLVGVVDADLGLEGGDLRAAERTYQLLYQVAGRAGRGTRPGRVCIQTYSAAHPVLSALSTGDRDAFIHAELLARKNSAMPPYGKLVALIISGEDERAVDEGAANLSCTAPNSSNFQILGPAPAPIARVRSQYRRRFLLMAAQNVSVQSVVRAWLSNTQWSRKIRVTVDIDPYSFM